MKGSKVVVGVFSYLDDTLSAVSTLKKEELEYTVYSPTYIHDIDHATSPGRSPVALLSGTGAVIGLCSGFSLAVLCGLDWPLRTSAKAIASIPGFVVIGYECTILFGAIFTLLGILHFCRLPDLFHRPGYDPRFSDDKFGVAVGCEKDAVTKIEEALKKAGAEEVTVRDGL